MEGYGMANCNHNFLTKFCGYGLVGSGWVRLGWMWCGQVGSGMENRTNTSKSLQDGTVSCGLVWLCVLRRGTVRSDWVR